MTNTASEPSASSPPTRPVKIVTDSSSDLPAALVSELDITVVPLMVNFGTESFADGVDLDRDTFWARCAQSAELPRTAAVSAEVFANAYRDASSHGAHDVVVITVSAKLSATHESALTAAEELAGEIDVSVVDSTFVSMGAGTLVLMAARAAAAGASAAEIVSDVEAARDRTHLIAALDTFDNLRKGGRIGAAKSLLGTALSVKPLIEVANGVVVPAGRQRTRTKARAHLVSVVSEHASKIEEIAVVHARCPDVDDFAAQIRATAGDDVPFTVADIGPVVGAHAGEGAVGVVYRTSQ